jgi:uncharacterized RDD family membrane protein YckC
MKKASFKNRFFAFVLDLIIVGVPISLAEKYCSNIPSLFVSFSILLLGMIYLPVYRIGLLRLKGYTLGKYIMKIKVVKEGADRLLNYNELFRRELIFVILGILGTAVLIFSVFQSKSPLLLSVSDIVKLSHRFSIKSIGFIPGLFLLVDILYMNFNESKKAIHDYFSNSIVIRG